MLRKLPSKAWKCVRFNPVFSRNEGIVVWVSGITDSMLVLVGRVGRQGFQHLRHIFLTETFSAFLGTRSGTPLVTNER